MSTLIAEHYRTIIPTESEALLALESSRYLATKNLAKETTVYIKLIEEGEHSETVAVPASAVRLFLNVLTEMAQGRSVTLIPSHAELTIQQAAELLNVSRPYVVKLLDEGKIPFRVDGKYRRVRFDDVMAFKQQDDQFRSNVLDELTAEAQELGMGY